MNTFLRLSRFGSTVKKCAAPLWQAIVVNSERGMHWSRARPKAMFWAGGLSIALAFLVFSGATAAGAALLAWAALRQAATANDRHQEQTNADRQRRITESFAKAVEQLGSDKLEVRLGGIYLLERISKESPDDYWTAMESLTGFVRERSRRNEAERLSQDVEQRISNRAYLLWQEAGKPEDRADEFWMDAVEQDELGEPPATDIAAVLAVIKRRSDENREREATNDWCINLSGAVLRSADLIEAHLERANLEGAHLEGANLWGAHLEGASLARTHLRRASLRQAHLKGARLWMAHFESADLSRAHLEGAELWWVHFENAMFGGTNFLGADFGDAFNPPHFEGAFFAEVTGLSEEEFRYAHGDARTRLPAGVVRPAHWPPSAPDPEDAAPPPNV